MKEDINRFFLVLVVLYTVSRFFFLANYPHFYDSPEYFRESLSTDFLKSIALSHESVHPVYLFLTQTAQQSYQFVLKVVLGKSVVTSQVWTVSLISAIFGLLGFLSFYLLIKRLFDKKIALFSLIPLIFFPHLWLIQTNVLHEAVEQGFFLLSLLFFDLFLEKKKPFCFLLAILNLSLAIVNFVGIIIWFPVILGLSIFRSKKETWLKNICWGLIIALVGFLISLVILYELFYFTISDPLTRLNSLILGYGGKGIFVDWNFLNLLRVLRNVFLIAVNGYSIFVVLTAVFFSFYLYKKKKYKILILVFSFFAPFFMTGKFWYGGFFGRYSSLVAYPFALLLGYGFFKKSHPKFRKLYWLVIGLLIISFIPTLFAYQQKPVSEVQRELINQSGVSEEDLLILSDYQRPQASFKNALYISGSLPAQKKIEEKINQALDKKQRVFISHQAVTFPYFQYDGQQIHIISKGDKKEAILKRFLEDKKLNLVTEKREYQLLSVYQILPKSY